MDKNIKRIYGIDLGTTYSSIAYVDEYGKAVIIPNAENERVTPSVVFFDENNIVVGEVAKESSKLYPNEVVSFIREHSGDAFHLEVAAYPEFHPQAGSAEEDLKNFARKVEAGANSAITQYFFNADSYFYFIDRLEKMGVTIPVVPGIMPIINFSNLVRFSDMCGAEIPRWIRKQLEAYGDDSDSIRKFGEEVVTEMCEKLLKAGAPGLHFYTLNQVEPSLNIWKNLGISEQEKIAF